MKALNPEHVIPARVPETLGLRTSTFDSRNVYI
jgi:hypothetical protein